MGTILRGRDTKAQMVHRPGGERRESPNVEWVPTMCRMCLVGCGILVKLESGRVMNVIGNPDTPHNRGRMCAKGKSGIMNHYNPNRVTRPLRRTNAEKGIGVDPGWQPISWEEAIDTLARKLRKIIDEDPRKLYLQTWGFGELTQWLGALVPAIGTPYNQQALSGTCGKTLHSIQFLTAGGIHQEPDFSYCNYLIDVGSQQGVATREGFNHTIANCAAARERGMKLVVVDPVGNNAAAKADEWLPIRPGTDAAFGLGLLHLLLNELKIYDASFLKHHTNAGYLVGGRGKYARDGGGKPLVYDLADGRVKEFDDPAVENPALEGEYEVQGQVARPAFELLKARAAAYPPERVEEITSIPARTLRRIAREFGEAARVGATITIDGVELPYRPVALEWDRGPQGHLHAWHHTWAIHLVNLVLGAINVPGGLMSTETAQNWPTRAWPEAGQDGLLGHRGGLPAWSQPFPGRPPERSKRWDLYELFPVAAHTRTLVPLVNREPDKYGIDHRIEMVIHSSGNQVMGGWGDVRAVVDWYRGIDLVVGFAVEINETHELDDIVLPMPTYLEENSFGSAYHHSVPGEHVGFQQIQQRMVEPPEGVRLIPEVFTELYDRAGILDQVHHVFNRTWGLKPPYLLEPGQRYTGEEMLDRQAKSKYGEEFGWDFFKEHGVFVYLRDVDERYPGRFIKARIPVYMEYFIERGEELDVVLRECGFDWDLSDYDALPEWRACEAFGQLQRGEIDAIGVHYKLPYVYGQHGNANPWINELCEKLPHSYGVLINTRLARRKGIEDGDMIWLESTVARVKVVARVTEMVHPEVIGIAGAAGHWALGKPLSKGKGVNFNSLLPYSERMIDVISTALDQCAPLKLYKA